jgi:hypothetical protein
MNFIDVAFRPRGALRREPSGRTSVQMKALRLDLDYARRMKARIAALGLVVGSCAAPQPGGEQQGPARELAGRSAGAPQRCVLIQQSESLRVSDSNRHTLLYSSGRIIWANHLGQQCGFGTDDVLVTEPIGSYYCRGDLVRSFDRFSRIPGPTCILGDFLPYTR